MTYFYCGMTAKWCKVKVLIPAPKTSEAKQKCQSSVLFPELLVLHNLLLSTADWQRQRCVQLFSIRTFQTRHCLFCSMFFLLQTSLSSYAQNTGRTDPHLHISVNIHLLFLFFSPPKLFFHKPKSVRVACLFFKELMLFCMCTEQDVCGTNV